MHAVKLYTRSFFQGPQGTTGAIGESGESGLVVSGEL